MAKTQWTLLFSTFVISCISLAFIIVSFVTNNWIIAEAHVTGSVSNSKINYGLFGGILTRHILATGTEYDLTIICLYEDNACIYSCQRTPELRAEELKNITKGVNIRECGISTKKLSDANWSAKRTITTNMRNTSMGSLAIRGSEIERQQNNNTTVTNDQYIKPTVWLSTIIFLGITTFFAFTSALFAVVNIVFSPIEPILSILGLYIWNGITTCSALIVLLLWGTLYAMVLKENIIITDTLRIEYPSISSDLANLGYSYWYSKDSDECISKILAEAELANAVKNSEIKYGLFRGSLNVYPLESGFNLDLSIICLYEEGACIYSCQQTVEDRQDELRRILNNITLMPCAPTARAYSNVISEMNEEDRRNGVIIKQAASNLANEQYIPAGMWLTTVVFLSITLIFVTMSAVFAFLNIFYNPIHPILSVLGLYIWNGIASGGAFITILMWGILYGTSLIENVAISDTLRIDMLPYPAVSRNLANLGFSYWLLLCPMIFHIINIGLIFWRSHVIAMEPKALVITVERNDNTELLY